MISQRHLHLQAPGFQSMCSSFSVPAIIMKSLGGRINFPLQAERGKSSADRCRSMVLSLAELLVTFSSKLSEVITLWSQMTNAEICNLLIMELSNQHN